MNHISAVVAGLSLAFVGTSATFATTINVPGDQPTIAAAINAAVTGDVINIAAGTYNEHSLSTGGKAITIQGTLDACGARLTTINAQQNGRIFIINNGEGTNTLIQNLVITGGGGPSATPGGAFYCFGTTPTIRSCTISGNSTPAGGGGIFLETSNATITNCSITDNTSTLEGGGIISLSSSPIITSCTIASNTALNGGGGGMANFSGSPTLTDTSVCGNSPDQILGGYADGGGNLVDEDCTGACCLGNDCSIVIQDDCGGTWLGAGTDCNDITCFAGAIYVPGDYANIACAINASVNGDVIQIAAGTYNEHSLDLDGKAITVQGTIDSDGTLATTIDAQQGGPIFKIDSGEGAGTVIRYLNITGGQSTLGGGIACIGSSPSISGCAITRNNAVIGGGIWCQASNDSPTISNCKIVGNTSDIDGGGIACSSSSPIFTGCTISGNTAGNVGGGISVNNCEPIISGCTISGNTAGNVGGGIGGNNSSPTISGSTINGNTAEILNGGIYIDGSSNLTISSSIVCENGTDQIVGSYVASESCLAETTCNLCPGITFETNTPTGACCLGGMCMIGTEAECLAAGGTYASDDVACADANCATTTPGDVDGDGDVDVKDLDSLHASLGICQHDIDHDGDTDIDDLLRFLAGYGATCP